MSAARYSNEDGVAVLTLDNPPQNRFMGEFTASVNSAIQDLTAREDTRVLLVQATGPDFSHGGNVAGWIGQSAEGFSQGIARGIEFLNAFQNLPFPVIVAVQGYCGGGGFELALRGDIIIAAENARFCHSEASISAFTFMGGIQRVAERVGRTRAIQWAMTAEEVDAHTALQAGLVNDVVPVEDLQNAAQQWLNRFKDSATLAHAAHKAILRAWSEGGVADADAVIPELAGRILHSEDTQSCLQAAADAIAQQQPRPTFTFKGR